MSTETQGAAAAAEAVAPVAEVAAAPASAKLVRTLVLDTNVFVKALRVDHIADGFVTVPEVVQELRSRTARDQYQALVMKHGVKAMNPDAESLQAVMSFAKRTGDFASLALADMKVLALAFMLEKEANGMRRLRLEPVGENPDISDRKLLASAEVAHASKDGAEQELEAQMDSLALDAAAGDDAPADGDEAPASDDGWITAKPKEKKANKKAAEAFGGGWITPKNVKQQQAADTMGLRNVDSRRAQRLQVACVTSDFAMQNLMLKMGINLVTCDGVRVTRLRTWVLRCHACAQLTGDMGRQFCASCGHATLKRCSVSTGTDGRLQVHLKANYNHNLRGTIYSLPKPHGGRHMTKDVIVRADDRSYMRAIKHKQRMDAKVCTGADLLADPDYMPDLLMANPLSHGNGYGVATDARGMPMVARNRRNPNKVHLTGNRKKKRLHI
ncbi:20S-pre-rRNA D-site endonuclease nob1 [Coemansia spiralis]|nr:20S-pre-rRNA D-site endonuclease nob1 [Coemansia spiralis]